MTKQANIERTLKTMGQLPDEKAQEVADFADYVSKRYEESLLRQGTQRLVADSRAFDFLQHEEELYSLDDLKEVYNG